MSDSRLKRLVTLTPGAGYQVIYTVPAGFKTILHSAQISPTATGGGSQGAGDLTLNGTSVGTSAHLLKYIASDTPVVLDIPLSAGETIGFTQDSGGNVILIGEEIPV